MSQERKPCLPCSQRSPVKALGHIHLYACPPRFWHAPSLRHGALAHGWSINNGYKIKSFSVSHDQNNAVYTGCLQGVYISRFVSRWLELKLWGTVNKFVEWGSHEHVTFLFSNITF